MSQCTGEVNLNRIVNRKSRWNWNCEKTGCCQWNPWMYYDWCCCMYAAVPIKKGMLFWRMQSKLKSLQLFMFLSPFFPVKLWQLAIPSTWFSQCVTYRPETNFWNRVQKNKIDFSMNHTRTRKVTESHFNHFNIKMLCFVTIFKLEGHKSDFHYLLLSSNFFELYLPLMTAGIGSHIFRPIYRRFQNYDWDLLHLWFKIMSFLSNCTSTVT